MRVALLSIHPKYADAILGGQKRVEFRKQALRDDTEYVVIYATAPRRRVVGFFKIGRMRRSSPQGLWRRYSRVGGIGLRDFREYYGDRDEGIAIEIESAHKLRKPLALEDLAGISLPPQSYRYIDSGTIPKLRRYAKA